MARRVQEAGPPVAIAALQTLLERASLAATGRCAAALAADAAALAEMGDWDEPSPRLQDGASGLRVEGRQDWHSMVCICDGVAPHAARRWMKG